MQKSDEELMAEIADGSAAPDESGAALAELVSRYSASLFRFIKRYGVGDDASDITQEIFIKIWKNRAKFDPKSASAKTWIFTIAKNSAIDYLRKKRPLLFSDFDGDEENSFSPAIPVDKILPDEALDKLYDEKILEGALSGLSENYRTVLLLHYEEDMTFDEIGKVLGKPLNTVKSQHRRALIALRKTLLHQDKEEGV